MSQVLILATWAVWVVAFIGVGYLPAALLRRRIGGLDRVRAGLWLGLGLVMLAALLVNFMAPMSGPVGEGLALIVVIGGLAVTVWKAFSHRRDLGNLVRRAFTVRQVPMFAYLAILAIGIVVASNFATGEPMDADAGGYRIGAILYAADAHTVPGLAHLHFRFGFNSSLWPFGALVGNGGWDGQGWRIVTGIVLSVLAADNVLRLFARRTPGRRAGDWYIVVATAFTGAVILTDSGRWVPSPAQDIVFLVMCIASTGFLVDYVQAPRRRTWAASMSIVAAALAGSVRPLGWLFMGAVFLVVLARMWTLKSPSHDTRFRARISPLLLPGVFSALLLLLMMGRDAVLSGWIMYPLAALPLPVEWRVGNPSNVSRWITAWGRAPGADAEVVLASNDWFRPWLTAFWGLREISLLRWVALAAVIPVLWPAGRRAWRRAWRPLVWAISPSVILVAVWFISAPDIRFGWAFVLNVVALPFVLVVGCGGYPYFLLRIGGVLLLAGMMFASFHNGRLTPRGGERVAQTLQVGPLSVEVRLAPAPAVPPRSGTLADGTAVVFPSVGNNCWDLFPLCLLPGSGGDTVQRGSDWRDGFRSVATS